jgi:hypothetical protein
MNLTTFELCYIAYLILILFDNRDWWNPTSKLNEVNIAKQRLAIITLLLPLCLMCIPIIRVIAVIITLIKLYQYSKVLFCQGYIIIVNGTYKSSGYYSGRLGEEVWYEGTTLHYDNLLHRTSYWNFTQELERLTIELGYEPPYIKCGTMYYTNEQINEYFINATSKDYIQA